MNAVSNGAVTSVDVGVLVYDVGVSDTAQLFHIADQAAAALLPEACAAWKQLQTEPWPPQTP